MRILIVENSPFVRGMYGLAFSPREHELTTASEGSEALARISESTFDVVLLDLRMPGMDGGARSRAIVCPGFRATR